MLAERTGTCAECGRGTYGGSRCKRRNCPGYSPTWARDSRRCAIDNVAAYDRGNRTVAFVTVTAGGVKAGLPWDTRHCTHARSVTCSGARGCRVDAFRAFIYNTAMPAAWRALWALCCRNVERQGLPRPRLLLKVWQPQQRGVLHLHLLLGTGTLAERRSAERFVDQLEAFRTWWGFGYTKTTGLGSGAWERAERGAGYATRYLTDGRDGALSLVEALRKWDRMMPRQVVYVDRKLQRRTGVTVRALRLRRWRWRALTAGLEDGQEIAFMAAVHAAFPDAVPVLDSRGPPCPV